MTTPALQLLAVLGFCGGCLEQDPVDPARADDGSADAGQASATLDAATNAAEDASGPPVSAMTYHRADAYATSLELRDDGTFRWAQGGCDFYFGSFGRWMAEDGGKVLLPWDGMEQLSWPGDHVTTRRERVVLRDDGYQLIAELETDAGVYEQPWFPGGRCPVECAGTEAACDDPFHGRYLPPDAGS